MVVGLPTFTAAIRFLYLALPGDSQSGPPLNPLNRNAVDKNIAEIIGIVAGGGDLSVSQMRETIDQMMLGRWGEEEMGLLLTALAAKGETSSEVVGAAAAMRSHMLGIRSPHAKLLDTCGTGGGGSQTFNVSTTAAIVVAAAGVPVAKHGNRSITSRSGSADVLGELGVNLEATREQVEACLAEVGLCFCFAPQCHPAMRHVGPIRKKLGISTIFNILGPLANPAGAQFQVLGAGRPELRPLLAEAVQQLGTRRTLVVSGEGGVGDVTCSGVTYVSEVTPEAIHEYQWEPGDFGVERSPLEALTVDGPAASADLIRRILAGEPGPPRDIVVLNAAAGLLVAEVATDPKSAAEQAADAIDSGAAAAVLERLAAVSHRDVSAK